MTLDERIDVLCDRLGLSAECANAARAFVQRHGKRSDATAWLAVVSLISTLDEGETEAGEAVVEALTTILAHDRELSADELSELLSHGAIAAEVGLRLIATCPAPPLSDREAVSPDEVGLTR